MDITPASAVQVMDSGELVEVGDDVLGIAREIREINEDFRLRYSEKQDVWIVYQETRHPLTNELQKKQVVTTCRSPLMKGPLLERLRKVTSDSYDLAAEIAKVEKKAKRDHEHAMAEARGPQLERLAHAIRKDKGLDKLRISVPKSLVLPPGVTP